MTAHRLDGDGLHLEGRGNLRRDWARGSARRGRRALSSLLFLLILVAAMLSISAQGQAVLEKSAEPRPAQISILFEVIHVGPDVDTAAVKQRLAKPLPSDFNDILALFPAIVPVNSWDATATTVEDGETAARTVKPIWLGGRPTEFACLSAVTPRLQPDGHSVKLEYNITLNRVLDGRGVSFEGSPTVDDGDYHLADAVVEPVTSSQLFFFVKAMRIDSPRSDGGDPAPPRLRGVDVECCAYRVGLRLAHADLRRLFEDPLPSDSNLLRARFPAGERVETNAIQTVTYDGKTVTGGFTALNHTVRTFLTPRILASGKGLVLRCELVFEPKKPTPDEKPKNIVAMTFTDDDLFHLARVADDPTTSGTLLIFLKGKPGR